MSKSTTAFERWLERRRLANAPTEELYLNPLKAKIGEKLTIDLLGWEETEFSLVALRVVNRKIGNKVFPVVDYRIHGWTEEPAEIFACLRYIPLDLVDREAKRTHQVLLLSLVWDHGFEPDIQKLFRSEPKEFRGIIADQPEHFPERVEGVVLPYHCETVLILDEDQDGVAEREEVQEARMDYLDFWRLVREEESGIESTQYLFIETNPEDGWTEYLQGGEINPDVINTL